MSLTIIKTGLTKDSSTEYLNEIRQLYLSGTDKRIILVVPDSFSYTAEKRICETVGGIGINGVEVLTLHQLVRRLSGDVSVISSVGKQILAKKAIDECIADDSVFARSKDKPGFSVKVLDTVSRWRRHSVSESELLKKAEDIKETTVSEKIVSLASVYSAYNKLMEENACVDSSDELYMAADLIRQDESYKGAYIWIDEFPEFAPPELEIIRAFLERNAQVKIYLPIPETEPDDSIYDAAFGTYYELLRLAGEGGFPCSTEACRTDKKMAEEIKFLCDNYDADASFNKPVSAIKMHIAGDIYSETEYTASRIAELVTDNGYEFSDIAVLCGSVNDYSSCIEAVFEKYKIPYFSDYKVPLSGHPISILITSVFDIVRNMSFPLNSVIRYLKTGYPLEDSDRADIITTYAKAHGIKGSMWLEPKYFQTEKNSFFSEFLGEEVRQVKNFEELEELRKNITLPLCAYNEKTKKTKTVKEHIKAFFELLGDIQLFDKIENKINLCEAAGDTNEASRLMHVWNILIDIFNQMTNAVGDEAVTRDVFEEYLITGIESSEISIIPSTSNGVSVSDAGRRTNAGVRALFVLGAVRDAVPKIKKEEGIISDDELELFDMLPRNDTKVRYNKRMELTFLQAVSDVSELLYISAPKSASDGSKYELSPLFDSLSVMFPKCERTDEKSASGFMHISSPEAMLHRLLVKAGKNEVMTPVDICALDWFKANDKYKDEFKLIDEAVSYKALTGSISKEVSAKLYEKLTRYSVSRLEKYFACPFSYYMTYGLSVKEEKEYGIESTDTGTLIHDAAVKFCSEVEKCADDFYSKKEKWLKLSEERKKEIVDTVFEELKQKTETDPFVDNILKRVYKTMLRTADIITLSMQKSKYGILSCEMDFDGFTLETSRGTAELGGIIDRVDGFSENGTDYIRIIDYKTGNKEYKPVDMLNGIDIQLMIYAMAAEELTGGTAQIAGMFYNSLKRRIGTGADSKKAEESLKKSSKLSGCVFADVDDCGVLDIKTGVDMDSDLFTLKESSYLPLKLKKDDTYNSISSKAESVDFYRKMKGYVRDMVVDAAMNIEGGDVRVYPLEKSDSCKYCPYGSVCMYDIENGAEINTGIKGKTALEEIRKGAR